MASRIGILFHQLYFVENDAVSRRTNSRISSYGISAVHPGYPRDRRNVTPSPAVAY
ncbi:hypothetical protein [Methanohalophilus portucalensis]|uniref:hypothetical protein n=1 Tax=Methanohalophilus portucalensis TaxID=39664 RepID=UPI0012FD5990|nr:hypothetical protein [Methanohalophilus portucalensis]